jgi:hypothetical protein
VVSILFSIFCLVVMPVFTGAIIVAPLIGFAFAVISAALGARRTAAVTFAFALVPFCGFLVMETLSEHVGTGYVAFAPLVAAVVLAAWAVGNYSHAKRAEPRSAA